MIHLNADEEEQGRYQLEQVVGLRSSGEARTET